MFELLSTSNPWLFSACFSALLYTASAVPLSPPSAHQTILRRQDFGLPEQGAFLPLQDNPSGRFRNTLFPSLAAPTARPSPAPASSALNIAIATTSAVSPPPAIQSSSNRPAAPSNTSQAAGSLSGNHSHPSTNATTIAATQPTASLTPEATSRKPPSSGHTFELSFVNNIKRGKVNAYVTGLDTNGKVFLLAPDGSFYYPAGSQATPQRITANVAIPVTGSSASITIPSYMSSGRVWLSEGELQFSSVSTSNGPALVEPTAVNPQDASHDINWGFVEFTFNAQVGLFADISYVDFVGIPLGLELQTATNGNQSALGMPAHGAHQVCSLLQAKGKEDGQPWADLCVSGSNGKTLRVVSPSVLISNQASAFSNYWDDYLSSVYTTYASSPLTFNTQSSAGNVQCTSPGSGLSCGSSGGTFASPSAKDIFGCSSGPFLTSPSTSPSALAIIPRLCAALNRCTLTTVPGGNVQPSLSPRHYYQGEVCNWYSAMVHKVERDGKGYAFPYDDVTPKQGQDTAGIVADLQPVVLVVTVGGPRK